jgi:hypothetical protein
LDDRFYYGLTGFTRAWYYCHTLTQNARNLWLRAILPTLGGLILWAVSATSVYDDRKAGTGATSWTMPISPHWRLGGIFVIGFTASCSGSYHS